MQITKDLIKAIAPAVSDKSLEVFTPYLVKYQGDVNTPLRVAAFLAQVLEESGCLRWVHELASGEAYEGRKDLGNIYPGDGVKFKGRGLIQITGRSNYKRVSEALYGDDSAEKAPEVLSTPENAVRVAYWFWNVHGLNVLADASDFAAITKHINGGENGEGQRESYYNAALLAMTTAGALND